MRTRWVMVIVAMAALLGPAMFAQTAASAARTATKPPARSAAPSGSLMRPMVTVQDLMAEIIDPASKVVFNAVSSQTTATDTVETAPKNDAEWMTVHRNALLLVEGANLLLIPGRHFSRPENAQKSNEGELPPAEIEVRVARDRAAWNKLAVGLRDAGMGALKAAEARKKGDFGAVSEAIDTACESCHLRFWYPDQEKLLEKAPKPK